MNAHMLERIVFEWISSAALVFRRLLLAQCWYWVSHRHSATVTHLPMHLRIKQKVVWYRKHETRKDRDG